MKYQIIVSDPPWGNFKDKLKMSDVKRGAEANYSTMPNSDILSLDVPSLVDPANAVLALWVPSSILQDGLHVMKAWGFELKQTWIWVKIKKDPFKKLKENLKNNAFNWENINFDDFLSFGLGRMSRNVHEISLIGTKGKINKRIKNKSQRTVHFYQNVRHSSKPDILQDRLDLIFPDTDDYKFSRLEMFGRRLRSGWEVIGNESPSCLGEDIKDSIIRLKEKC